ncbi:MAG: hypothetical protein AUK64_2266, partial [bacterium P201]
VVRLLLGVAIGSIIAVMDCDQLQAVEDLQCVCIQVMSSVSKPRVRHNRHKQGLNLTLEKLSADFRL